MKRRRGSGGLGLLVCFLAWLSGMNPARATDMEVSAILEDARLMESLDGDLRGALETYENLLDRLEVGSENWDRCMYSIARVRFGMGEFVEAASVLRILTEDSSLEQEARNLYMRLEMVRNPIRSLPYQDPIELGNSRWIRGSLRGEIGDLHYQEESGRILSWNLQVVQSQTDFILLPLGPLDRPLEGLEFSARAREFSSSIIVILEDHDGGQWRTEILDLPSNVWTFVSVDLTNLIQIQGETASPDPSRLEALIIEDLTGQVSSRQGSNRIDIQSTRVY